MDIIEKIDYEIRQQDEKISLALYWYRLCKNKGQWDDYWEKYIEEKWVKQWLEQAKKLFNS